MDGLRRSYLTLKLKIILNSHRLIILVILTLCLLFFNSLKQIDLTVFVDYSGAICTPLLSAVKMGHHCRSCRSEGES